VVVEVASTAVKYMLHKLDEFVSRFEIAEVLKSNNGSLFNGSKDFDKYMNSS
jgi:hypothetical protein